MPWRLPTSWAPHLPSPPLWPCTCPDAPSSSYLQWSQNRALCQAEVTWISDIHVQRHHLSCTWSQGAEDAVSPTHVLSSSPTLYARPPSSQSSSTSHVRPGNGAEETLGGSTEGPACPSVMKRRSLAHLGLKSGSTAYWSCHLS